MKTFKAGLVVAVLIALALLFLLQHQAQVKLRADNAALMQQLAQLQTDSENFSNRLAAAGDAQTLSEQERNELLKLRGEVGVLKNQVGELGKLREENQQLQRQATVGQNQAGQISPEDQFRLNQFHTTDDLKQLGVAMRIYAGDQNGQYATNFYQLNDELGGNTMVTNFMSKYEFVNTGLVNESMPDDIIFREQNPHQNPSGGWERIYVFADGRVETQYSDDGNFDAYEKQHMVPPPNQ
jgi:hypothetical protein